jgi:hypothetical protein
MFVYTRSRECVGVCVLLGRCCSCPGVHEVQRGEFRLRSFSSYTARMPDPISLSQGRTKVLGRESAAGVRRRENRAARDIAVGDVDSKVELPQ